MRPETHRRAIGSTSDAAFWDRIAPRYAASKVGDPASQERKLDDTRALLTPALVATLVIARKAGEGARLGAGPEPAA